MGLSDGLLLLWATQYFANFLLVEPLFPFEDKPTPVLCEVLVNLLITVSFTSELPVNQSRPIYLGLFRSLDPKIVNQIHQCTF